MILVDGADTEGRLGLVDDLVPPGHKGPRLHLHRGFDEGFYPMDDTYLAYLIDAIVLPALRSAADPPPGPALFAGQPVPNHRRTHE